MGKLRYSQAVWDPEPQGPHSPPAPAEAEMGHHHPPNTSHVCGPGLATPQGYSKFWLILDRICINFRLFYRFITECIPLSAHKERWLFSSLLFISSKQSSCQKNVFTVVEIISARLVFKTCS